MEEKNIQYGELESEWE